MKPLVVNVEDAFGNLAITDQSDIVLTASLAGSSAISSALGGTLNVAAQGGVATFNGLAISTAGTYTLTAADAALTPAVSAPITVSQPAHVSIAGNDLPRIAIDAETAFGSAGVHGKATVVLQSDAGNGATVLTRTVGVKDGLIEVGDIRMFKAGNYTMLISNSQGDSVSEQFTVVPAPPKKLVFTTQPTTVNGQSPVSVSVVDAYGNISSAMDGKTIRLHLGSIPVLGKNPVLTGTTTAQVVNGTAVFPAAMINRTGRGRLVATAPHLQAVQSDVFQNG
jgi:hypothetical protein